MHLEEFEELEKLVAAQSIVSFNELIDEIGSSHVTYQSRTSRLAQLNVSESP